jgi:RHS repeat-associated protein
MRRLNKVHTAGTRSLPKAASGRKWRELDSSMSSDALLMNIFCAPGVWESQTIRRTLGVEGDSRPQFGWKARVPLASGRFDRTEVDMRWGNLLVEAKLTESDFQTRSAAVVQGYRDFNEVFDRGSLPLVEIRTRRRRAAVEFAEDFSQEWEPPAHGDELAREFQAAIVACASGANDNAQLTVTTPTVQNQVSGFQYDAAGNVTYDQLNHYLYDPEGRLCAYAYPLASGGWSYYQFVYDAEGRRVAKGSITSWPSSCIAPTTANGYSTYSQHLLGQGGETVTQLDASGNANYSNVFNGGQLLGSYNFTGSMELHFALTDPLGTKRVQATFTSAGVGAPELNCLSLPFGNNLGNTGVPNCISVGNGGVDDNKMHFTGKERDSESGNDYFGARYYSSTMGRFMSPDWSAKVTPVPYAKLGDPQTLNLYAYVGYNPLTRRDLDGHVIALGCAAGTSADQCNKDKNPELQRIAANASKKGEAALFKSVTDKNGKTTMVLDKAAAANFKGDHSAGYNLLTGAIDAKQTISVEMSNHDSFTGIPDAKGNMTVNLDRNVTGLDSLSPLKGFNGQNISNLFQIIAGHEVLGHAYASDILGLTKGMSYGQEEHWVRENIENTLRQEQGIPLRDPNSN